MYACVQKHTQANGNLQPTTSCLLWDKGLSIQTGNQDSPKTYTSLCVFFAQLQNGGGSSQQQQEAAAPFNQYAETVVGGQ